LRRILIRVPSVAQHYPRQFWRPSPRILQRLRPPTEVQLRVIEYDEQVGADLWDSDPVWARLTKVGPKTCTGELTISEIDTEGFRKGDTVRFEPDHVFDLFEVDERGRPIANRSKAAFIRGKDVLLGLTYLNADGSLNWREQLYGTIEVANNTRGIGILLPGRPGLFTLPPDLRSIQPAAPGTYRLKTTGEVIEDPTFVCTWTITAPAPGRRRPTPRHLLGRHDRSSDD
jgi:hypothetical protein